MLRKPPGFIAITFVAAFFATGVYMGWTLGGGQRTDLILMMLATPILCVFFLVWAGSAFRHAEKTAVNAVRASLCPVLLLAGFVAVAGDVPMKVRFALSRPSLDAYVHTLHQSLPVGAYCDSSEFEERRVGRFTVTCVDRPDAETFALHVAADPLSPNGAWYLVWRLLPDAGTRNRLGDHWSLGMED